MTGDAHDPRLERVLEVMLSIAQQDFDVEAPVSGRMDVIDAIAVGLNMLVEELRGEVASRRELERTHEALKEAQARLVHAEKLAAIGQLAAGVAHEINTPIQSVQVSLAIVERVHRGMLDELRPRRLGPDDVAMRLRRAGQAIIDAQEAVERVRDVSDSLRTFARVDDDREQEVSLAEIVRASCRMVEPTLRSRARLELELDDGVRVRGNGGRLGQVVTNLLVNAVQALPEARRSSARVRVCLESLEGEARLTVEDNGPGVPAELRARIFEPYFTTKPEGVGTGLGLALSQETVRAHRGSVAVDDSPLGGARFTITLPRITEEGREPESDARRTTRRVLLIDDEPMLLRLLGSFLGESHAVVTAASGDAGLAILAKDDRFDLVLCDLHMPGKDGIDVFEAVTRANPALAARFVFATGGAFTARTQRFLELTRPRTLTKPFKIDALFALLDDGAQAGPVSS